VAEHRRHQGQLGRLFTGMAREYLSPFGAEVDHEVELGRPVDFKISAGNDIRLLSEVKRAHTGTFWNGLNDQLPSYIAFDEMLTSERARLRMERLIGFKARIQDPHGRSTFGYQECRVFGGLWLSGRWISH
jgi:hypothetical protein